MHPSKSCKTCSFVVYFVPKGELQGVYICKRFPPRQNFMGIHPQSGPMFNINHPPVQPLEWCHEHKPLENGQEVFHESANSVTVAN